MQHVVWGATFIGNSTCTKKVRWTFGGFSDPQVYFRDHTSSTWPVSQAVAQWNKAVGVDSYYGGCGGSGTHCVDVYNARYNTGWVGYTYITYNSSFNMSTVVVHFNDNYSQYARQAPCHELGHALGLFHNSSTASCMYGAAISSGPNTPNANDYSVLRYVVYP